MAELQGNTWRIYPDDAPGTVGRTSPAISELHVQRIVWQPDGSSVAGDAIHLKDRKGNTVYFHEAVNGETEFVKEYNLGTTIAGPLEVASLASGFVEVVLV